MPRPRSKALAEHLRAARKAWPTLAWDEDDYVAWLVAHGGDQLDEKLVKITARDALLCFTAARGDVEAHRLFEAHVIPHVGPAISRQLATPALIDEVAQRLRVKLLVAKPGQREAPIARFALGGSLIGLVRVAAMREAVGLQRGNKPVAPPAVLDLLVGDADPQLRILKRKYATEFERAFVTAVASLETRERQLLRLHLSAKASIDDIARVFDTHRATAARWLQAARDALAEKLRALLVESLQLSEDELASILRLVRTEATRLMDSIAPEPGDPELP